MTGPAFFSISLAALVLLALACLFGCARQDRRRE